MAGLKLAAFAGIAPRVSKTLLKDNEAQTSVNTNLYTGEIRSWRRPGSLPIPAATVAGCRSIYRHNDVSGDDLWLSWNVDVNVVPGPIYATGEYPIYYTGDGTPKKTNAALAETGSGPFPGDSLAMGVPTPTVAPTVTPSGGSGTAESRVYLYTFISMFGAIEEESAPSPASSVISVLPGGTVAISGLPSTAPTGDYNITKMRIYRAVTGTTSVVYLKVADVNIGTTTYSDTKTATQLGGSLTSSNYSPPPSDLSGLVAMANGILAGFRGNEVYFSEPFIPHAWPIEYSLTVEYPIIAIAAFGESLVVATQGNPFVISGSTPQSMSQAKIPLFEPCVSKRSIVSDDTGVMYASPNGIVKIAQGFAGVSTASLFTRDEWQIYKPSSMLGAILDGAYHLFYEDLDNDLRGSVLLDRGEQASALTTTTQHTNAVYVDPVTADLYLVEESQVKSWEGDLYNFIPYEWKSKVFHLARPVNFAVAQVEADFGSAEITESIAGQTAEIIAANQALLTAGTDLESTLGSVQIAEHDLAGSLLTSITSSVEGRYIQVKIFCNYQLIATRSVTTRKEFRLPSGYKGDRWEFQFNGNIPLLQFRIAETAKELAGL
jgi:hypothetical protein